MRKHDNFSAMEHSFARSTHHQFAELNQAIRTLSDRTQGLARGLRVPVPRGGSRYIKGSRTHPSALVSAGVNSLGNFFARGLLSDFGFGSGSFYTSASQYNSLWTDAFQQAQRIR